MNTHPHNLLVSAEDLSKIIGSPDLIILDCRFYLADTSKGRKEYLQQHIPGAYFLDMEHDLSSSVVKGVTGRHPLPDPEVLTYTLRATGINPTSKVVVYDQMNSMAAARAWWLLQWLGHTNVFILNGGIKAWEAKGYNQDNQWPPPEKGVFEFKQNPSLTIDKFEVASGSDKIIDSRDFIRYTGESEPIDPVAGHIPGAICIPFVDNTDTNGFWKSPSFLQHKFAGIDTDDEKPPVFYCGSGISACHNILAYKIATGKNARLYPGSWSEWLNYYPAVTGHG
ncbi:MAG: sulfurtransferase [Saprospiraceae bacterium]|nr:sulfurtransferase [Saprospiraceae bacterium]